MTRQSLVHNPDDVTVYAPDLPRQYEPHRAPWSLPGGRKVAVSVLLHAPAYRDVVPPGSITPAAMQGGVGRETKEPAHGQVARLSQWDFGLSVGIFRLLGIAERAGVPVAVALDEYGVTHAPGLAGEVGRRAQEVVARGTAANIVLGEALGAEAEHAAILSARSAVERTTGRSVTGWFSPERAVSSRTHRLLAEAGFGWFGDWPVDEVPVRLASPADAIVSLPFGLETEDVFALYSRGLGFADYERLVHQTVEQLVADADVTGARFLGLSWFGWVLGQACFADVAERLLTWLVAHPDVDVMLPSQAAALATGSPAGAP